MWFVEPDAGANYIVPQHESFHSRQYANAGNLNLNGKASSTLEATRDTRREEMGPVPFLCLLHHALLGVCNVNRTAVTTRSCTS